MTSLDTTQHEWSLVKSYLLLTFIQKVFERDSLILEESGMLKTLIFMSKWLTQV